MDRLQAVDAYLESRSDWTEGLRVLREALLAAGLVETVKWGAPCYTHAGRNLVSLAGFKNYFCLWFHEGGSLSDPHGVLQSAEDSKSEAMRHWRFTSPRQIKKRVLKAYLFEAKVLAEQPKAKKRKPAGMQREYAEYINEAKRAATKQSRLAKITPMILAGVGLNDRYRC